MLQTLPGYGTPLPYSSASIFVLMIASQFTILQIFIETQVCNAHLSYVTSKHWQD